MLHDSDAVDYVLLLETMACLYLMYCSQGNRIGSEGLFALSTALMSNTSLKEIVLTDNAIGSVSSLHIYVAVM